MKSTYILFLIIGFFLGASNVDVRQLIDSHPVFFVILATVLFVQMGLEVIFLIAKIKRQWDKQHKLKKFLDNAKVSQCNVDEL